MTLTFLGKTVPLMSKYTTLDPLILLTFIHTCLWGHISRTECIETVYFYSTRLCLWLNTLTRWTLFHIKTHPSQNFVIQVEALHLIQHPYHPHLCCYRLTFFFCHIYILSLVYLRACCKSHLVIWCEVVIPLEFKPILQKMLMFGHGSPLDGSS